VEWCILGEDHTDQKYAKAITGGVGVLLESELFKYAKTYAANFGLTYSSVVSKVVLLVQVDGAMMTTARAGVVIPGYGDAVPWKMIGAAFVDDLPAEIQALIDNVKPPSTALNDEVANQLDAEWKKKIKPVPTFEPASEGEAEVGDDEGDAQPPGEEPIQEHSNPGSDNGTVAPRRVAAGDRPAKKTRKTVTPNVEFIDPPTSQEMASSGYEADFRTTTFIRYTENSNLIQVSRLFPPYVRDVARWAAEMTDLSVDVVASAVEIAYGVELAAAIIDANGQDQHGLEPAFIEKMKEPPALYAKCLGVQSLERTIEANLRAAVRTL
jgi:hypothetical protein